MMTLCSFRRGQRLPSRAWARLPESSGPPRAGLAKAKHICSLKLIVGHANGSALYSVRYQTIYKNGLAIRHISSSTFDGKNPTLSFTPSQSSTSCDNPILIFGSGCKHCSTMSLQSSGVSLSVQ